MDLDLTATLFVGDKLTRNKPTTTKSQTSLPLIAGHHDRRRREEERPAERLGEELKRAKSLQGYSLEEYVDICSCRGYGFKVT
jgi:hypothetical protein